MTWFGRKKSRSTAPSAVLVRPSRMLESLEERVLFHVAQTTPLADVTVTPGAAATQVNLSNSFDNTDFTGTLVRFATTSGNIDIELFDQQKPTTVANFLNYVNGGDYNGTVIHRVTTLNDSGIGVVQGGGYTASGLPTGTHITTDNPIPLEVQTNGVIANARGTIAMARTSQQNSATSEFFINYTDNSTTLGPSNGGGYAVFGQLVDNTISTADAIAALTRTTIGPFTTVPLVNAGGGTGADNLVTLNNASVLPELTYSIVSNSNAALVTPAITNNQLTLNYADGQSGTSQITVRATSLDGNTLDQTFNVSVEGGNALTVTIGTGGVKAATFTDADGTVNTVTLKGGTAALNFVGSGLTQSATSKGTTINGTGIDLQSIAITASAGTGALTVKSSGGNDRVNVGTITSDGALKSISGKLLALTNGTLGVTGAVGKLQLLRAENATINLTGAAGTSAIDIDTVVDSNITSEAPLKSISLGSFNTTANTGADTISAASIGKLTVDGDFVGRLTVGGDVSSATVNGGLAGGGWTITGNLGKASANTVANDWSGAVTGDASSVTVKQDFAGTFTARTLKSAKIGGGLTNATLAFTAPSGVVGLGKLTVTGAVSGSSIRSLTADLGTITVGSLANSTIYAIPAIPDGGALPSTLGEVGAATIKGVTVKQKGQTSYVSSNIAAGNLGKLNLGIVQLDNGAVPFGVAANTLASLTATASTGTAIKLSKLDDPTAAASAISALGDLDDFVVRIF